MRSSRIAHVATVDLTLRFLLLPQLRALRDAGFDVSAISAPGPWVGEIEAEGIRHIPWRHATRGWDLQADALAFRELVAILRRGRFDLVHTHNPKPGVMGRVAARIAGVPRVLNTVHGLYTTPEDRLRRKVPVLAAEWLAARFSDLELYQSAEDLAWARRLRLVRPERSVHLSNGVDLAAFSPELARQERIRKLRAELGIGEDEMVVGTVGRMVREKGYEELFEAARIVRARWPEVRFLAVGEADCAKSDAVTTRAIEAARADFVFTGWRADVADLMALMDVFVLPSWREGLPRSATEALASGLPQVLTGVRGCREVVHDGVEGLLVPVRDPERLADAILRLAGDPSLRRRMAVAARARAESVFDERRVTAIVVDETRRLLGVPKGDPQPAQADGIRLRPARPEDAAAMARLHRDAMPTAFLPTLGHGFLRRLYRSMAGDAGVVAIVAEDRGRVAGFVTAAASVSAFYRRFARREGIAAALAAAPHLARPSVLRRAIETVRYPRSLDGLPEAELLSIAVTRSQRSVGVGTALVEGTRRELARMGVAECRVVVGADNRGANGFYERLGCRLQGATNVHRGAASNVWVMTCPS